MEKLVDGLEVEPPDKMIANHVRRNKERLPSTTSRTWGFPLTVTWA